MISPTGSTGCPESVVRLAICVILSSHLVACMFETVTVRVKPFTNEHFPVKPQGFQIDEWPTAPSRPYRKIAKLIGTAETEDGNMVRAALIKKARALGADAVIIQKVDRFKHMGAIHYQLTQNAGNTYSVFGGGSGSGFPMFFDPWTYVQTPADGITWAVYMDFVAIRYGDSE